MLFCFNSTAVDSAPVASGGREREREGGGIAVAAAHLPTGLEWNESGLDRAKPGAPEEQERRRILAPTNRRSCSIVVVHCELQIFRPLFFRACNWARGDLCLRSHERTSRSSSCNAGELCAARSPPETETVKLFFILCARFMVSTGGGQESERVRCYC